jgi:DNA-binding NtrC family response regulator
MRTGAILIVEDEDISRDNMAHVLTRDGHKVTAVASGEAALETLSRADFDLVLTDLKMHGVDGLEVLATAKSRLPGVEVVVITGHASVSTAVEAMRLGAYHYLPKPYSFEELRLVVDKALEKRGLRQEVESLKRQIKGQDDPPAIIGQSPAMLRLKQTIEQIAPTDCTVLILGETGTGKERVARAIHAASRRADKRFLAINCGALSEELLTNELFGHEREAFTGAKAAKKGLLEAADGGTFLFDEVGDMSSAMQVKLLRVLEERAFMRVGGTREVPVDLRVLAATNKDLTREMETGGFRRDLFYRLNVITLNVPPLSERGEDILILAGHFLRRFAARHAKPVESIAEAVKDILLDYPFPGNVRELENVIERAVALCDGAVITPAHLPHDLLGAGANLARPGRGRPMTLEESEREHILNVLRLAGGNKSQAAELLGIDRASLWRKLKRYGVDG